jgi:predicted Zn-dependent peptidase
VYEKAADQAHICLGVPGYPIAHPDRYVVELLRTVLGGGMSSRLFTEVRERRGLAYYVFTANQAYTDSGTLYSQAGIDLKRVDEAVTTVLAELRKIASEPVPADELEKSRSYAKGRFVLSLESPQGTNMFGLRREVLEGQATEPSEVLAELDKVTADDILRVAKELVRDESLRLAVIGPFDDTDRFGALLT